MTPNTNLDANTIIAKTREAVESAIKVVAAKTKLPVLDAYPCWGCPEVTMGYVHKYPGFIQVSPFFLAIGYTQDEMEAIIAHEYGHFSWFRSYDRDFKSSPDTGIPLPIPSKKLEYMADSFAKSLGYAKPLIAAFERIRDLYGDGASDTHPTFSERILRLEESSAKPEVSIGA